MNFRSIAFKAAVAAVFEKLQDGKIPFDPSRFPASDPELLDYHCSLPSGEEITLMVVRNSCSFNEFTISGTDDNGPYCVVDSAFFEGAVQIGLLKRREIGSPFIENRDVLAFLENLREAAIDANGQRFIFDPHPAMWPQP